MASEDKVNFLLRYLELLLLLGNNGHKIEQTVNNVRNEIDRLLLR